MKNQGYGWTLLAAIMTLAGSCVATADADWPMWRYDANRSAASPSALPPQLHLQWKVELPPPRPAFPHDNRLHFDRSYEPVVMGNTLYVPSMVTDSVTAMDTRSGRRKWIVFADAPVRFAPVAWRDKVYFVADDGYLYCLDGATGSLVWKFTPIPAEQRGQKLLGHERLVSRWPARGGPLLVDEIIYFASGVFPFEGVYVCALRADSGEVVWVNDQCAIIEDANQDHGGAWDAGLSPQGYLSLVGDKLAVASGRALPAFFDRHTGEMEPYSAGWGGRIALAKGSWYVASLGAYYFHSGDLYGPLPNTLPVAEEDDERIRLADLAEHTAANMETVERWLKSHGIDTVEKDGDRMIPLQKRGGSHLYWTPQQPWRPHEQQVQRARPRLQMDPVNDKYLGEYREPVLTPEAVYYSAETDLWLKSKEGPSREIVAFDITKPTGWKPTYTAGAGPGLIAWPTVAYDRLWTLPSNLKVHIKAGPRLYCGAAGTVAAIEIPEPDGPPHVAWEARIEGTPSRVLAADDRLFVVTQEGAIYAFGGNAPTQLPAADSDPPPTPADAWTEAATEAIRQTGVEEGYCLALGVGTGRLVEELVRQSTLHVIVLESDGEKVHQGRRRWHARGLYGTRIHVIPADLSAVELPSYLACLVVSEDFSAAGLENRAMLAKLYAALRPYGGVICLPAAEEAGVQRWIREADPHGAELRQVGSLCLLARTGAPADAADWTHEAGGEGNTFASADLAVKPPFRVLWFGGALDRLGSGTRHVPRVAGGRMFVHFHNDLLALDIYTGRELWRVPDVFAPALVAVDDQVYVPKGGACLRLDAATGSTLGRIEVPATAAGESRSWSALRLTDAFLVGSTGKPFRFPQPFEFDFVGALGEELVCLDRRSGTMLWEFQPKRDGLSFAMGAETVFCVDYWLPVHRRRGKPNTEDSTIYAIDLATGKVRWQTNVRTPAAEKNDSPFGTYQPIPPWLAYCESDDLLVLTANWSILGAWRGNSGVVQWTGDIPCSDPPSRYSMPQPPILLPGILVTHGGQMVDPKTGTILPDRLWEGVNRGTRGCNRPLANPHVVLLRDADIAYYHLAAGGRQTRLTGVRSGCFNPLMPAGGILNVPNLAHHCSCNWPIFTSMAMFPVRCEEEGVMAGVDAVEREQREGGKGEE